MTVAPPLPLTTTTGTDAAITKRVLRWLRNDLPDYPFAGLEEGGHVDVPQAVVPPGKGSVLDQLFPPDNLLRIQVGRSFCSDQLTGYRLYASGLVGITAVGDKVNGEAAVTLTVYPKVPGSSLLTMLSYALVPDLSSPLHPSIRLQDATIVSIILLIYLLRLQQLAQGHGLQRTYIRLEEPLYGTVRGRCKLPTYLQRNVPMGRPYIVPCDFWELRVDSEPNRALRWGIEVCRLLGDWLSNPELSRAIEKQWDILAPHFAGITLAPYQASQVRRLPRTGRFAPYGTVLELLEILLENLSLDIGRGQVRVRGFAIEMWRVFEQFVVNVLARHMRGQVRGPQVGFGYEVKDEERVLTTKKIYLDALVGQRSAWIVDAKWKEAITSSNYASGEKDTLQFENLRIRNADLFQVIAYGCHKKVQAEGALLVYPVLGSESVCRERRILDFSMDKERIFPVLLVGIPVGVNLRESIGDFVQTVQDAVLGPDQEHDTA